MTNTDANAESIRIEGLSRMQVKLLNKMWSLNTETEYNTWKESLPKNTKKMVFVLEEMLLAAILDTTEIPEEIAEETSEFLSRL